MTSPSPDTGLVERLVEAGFQRQGEYTRYEYVAQNAAVEKERATKFARSVARQAVIEALTAQQQEPTKVYVAVDHTGCIYECEDEDRVIRTARSAFATAVRRAQQQEPVGEVEEMVDRLLVGWYGDEYDPRRVPPPLLEYHREVARRALTAALNKDETGEAG